LSDDEDESNSLDNDNINGFGNLYIDDKNANLGAHGIFSEYKQNNNFFKKCILYKGER